MKKIELIQSIKQQDLILANAVSKMVDYIQDKWAAPYPSKEQTEAVNDYLRSVHANGDGTMNETAIAHRKIATQKITINAIRVLDHEQLDRLLLCVEPHSSRQGVLYARKEIQYVQVAELS